MKGERCNALRENEGRNDGGDSPFTSNPLYVRLRAKKRRKAYDGERKGVAEGFIVSAHGVRRCDLELLL